MSGVQQQHTCFTHSDAEHGACDDHHTTVAQPRRYGRLAVTSPQPDYMSWSTASLFICFIWGIFAYRASNRVRKFNKMKAYEQAAHYSENALKYNRSAVACSILMLLIIGVPLVLALIVQGLPSKFPNPQTYFGQIFLFPISSLLALIVLYAFLPILFCISIHCFFLLPDY